ncbi:cobyric acid synthase CobQ [Methanobrevibacter sp. TMH8]|uniref:cobyric acid synthase CobQ n=1 Tax=Methanobrevibacter sp. TMH8 TaxID=2848611 RepID=UPI001CC8FE8D|nr:cobyric acid synthase CobQ [Methanobrevibacter sp. TMH8]MBZ9570658.1 cobyric acid synthase CobQ [Methanobrevibacter sp. TMH8]
MAKCIMVQGTSSNAGKSVMVAALCRIYSRRGYKVAPFKSQNMSLNSYTTKENGEIAIAQVLQAEAADIEPSIHMNPILLKPKGNFTSQVIIQGKAIADMNFYQYQHDFRDKALAAIKESLAILDSQYDIIIIEGAGSPAEINMRKEDLANMEIAHMSDADVFLVADIDKGGVFASIAGTFSLLDDYDRSRLKAVIINKFSGNLDILMPGIEKIEKIIDAPVLGVLPYDHDLQLPEEDSASLFEHKFNPNKEITIGVIRFPKIANFTDIDPFEFEEDVGLKLIDINESIADEKGNTSLDAIILPGTRNTTEDMIAIEKSGLADQIRKIAKNNPQIPIVGLCGGYQILGNRIFDENNRESQNGSVDGLGLLDIETHFKHNSSEEKIVEQSEGIILDKSSEENSSNSSDIFSSITGEIITGYEIHEGTTTLFNEEPLLKIEKGIGNKKEKNKEGLFDGSKRENIFGTYFHGIFHNYNFRRALLNYIRENKGIEPKFGEDPYETKKDYSIDKLAEIVEKNLDMDFIDNLINK